MGKTRPRTRLVAFSLVLLAVTLLVAPAAAANDLVSGTIGQVTGTNGDGVNVRSEPGLGASRVGGLPEGVRVRLVDGPQSAADGSVWYKVQADGIEGWVAADYLAPAVPKTGDVVQVTGTDGYGLRVRAAASLDSGVLAIMPEGGRAEVTGTIVADATGTEWVPLRYDGIDGFAVRAYLVVVDSSAGAASSQPVVEVRQVADKPDVQVGGNVEVVNTDGQGLNVRYGAGYDHPVATVAPEGTVMRVIGGPQTDSQGITWWQVDYRGIQGWVHGGYLAPTDRTPEAVDAIPAESNTDAGQQQTPATPPPPSSVGEQIVATAMQYLGRPYAWGGTTPAGFDCSGFVYFVVNQVLGGGFPRSLEAQAVSGVYVDPDHLQPGDIVFFQNTYKWGLSHVGIYIGNGRFIHAENYATGVTISDVWGGYYGPRYYTARRIVP